MRFGSKTGLWVFLTVAGACVGASSGTSQDQSAQHIDTGSAEMVSPDVKFADQAFRMGEGEIQLGKLIQEKAVTPGVKAFGGLLVRDHTEMNVSLSRIARDQTMTLPTNLLSKDQALQFKLQNVSGVRFDRTYLQAMVKDHKNDLKGFRKEAKSGQNPQIKEFASQSLPVLRAHLEQAKAALAELSGKHVKK